MREYWGGGPRISNLYLRLFVQESLVIDGLSKVPYGSYKPMGS